MMARTLPRLGLVSIWRVAAYRTALKLGIHPVQRIKPEALPPGRFFDQIAPSLIDAQATTLWSGESLAFGHASRPLGDAPPDFLADALTGQRGMTAGQQWWETPIPDGCDIKRVWEFSRFEWALAFAQRARQGDTSSLARLNQWLDHWHLQNPPYCGPNWKCGQEAAIRVLHLAMAMHILNDMPYATARLRALLRLHLARIAPTLGYAVGQDNNHAITEAAGLFVGGALLRATGEPDAGGWEKQGRACLEERVGRLFCEDGTFSLYALNYHRAVLDVICMVEVVRQRTGSAEFSEVFRKRIQAATEWLRHLVDPRTGDAPNLGANDGTRLLNLVETGYRDYRPTVARCAALFLDRDATGGLPAISDALAWLNIPRPKVKVDPPGHYDAAYGGFRILRTSEAMAVLRTPHYRFRPGHADGLHVDLWHKGVNVLRDGGTYSYLLDDTADLDFSGSRGHNNVSFDGVEPMPRIGRFLFADWQKTVALQPMSVNEEGAACGATLRNHNGTEHKRTIHLTSTALAVEDHVHGFAQSAVFRWRLCPGDWQVDADGAHCAAYAINLKSSVPIDGIRLVQGWESRHYLEKTPVQVLEIQLGQSGTVRTLVRLTP